MELFSPGPRLVLARFGNPGAPSLPSRGGRQWRSKGDLTEFFFGARPILFLPGGEEDKSECGPDQHAPFTPV